MVRLRGRTPGVRRGWSGTVPVPGVNDREAW